MSGEQPATGDALEIATVHDLQGLDELEASWSAVHRADPEANVFLSWPWMRGRLASLPEPWSILVARSTSGAVAGLLALRHTENEDDGTPTLAMAGSPLADYTGFLCAPDWESQVLGAWALLIRDRLDWRRLEIRDTRDPRLDRFLKHFSEAVFQIERHPPTPCPFIDLGPYLGREDAWESYLREGPKPRMRRKMRRDMQEIENLPNLRCTSVEDGGEGQISAMLGLWQKRWGQRSEQELAQYRSIFESSLRSGCLWLDILWDGEVPISGRLNFLDDKRQSFCDYITCFDESYAEYSPGIVIAAHSIREAIRRGYRTFDFLRGDEYYKFALGAQLRHTENVTVVRNDG